METVSIRRGNVRRTGASGNVNTEASFEGERLLRAHTRSMWPGAIRLDEVLSEWRKGRFY
jgi:hypothetical protein